LSKSVVSLGAYLSDLKTFVVRIISEHALRIVQGLF
jgi:hypothetical protein